MVDARASDIALEVKEAELRHLDAQLLALRSVRGQVAEEVMELRMRRLVRVPAGIARGVEIR